MQSEVLNVINDLKLDMTASPVDDVTIITRAQLEAIEAALSAAEPVAWQIVGKLDSGSTTWKVVEHEHQAREEAKSWEKMCAVEVHPLYAAPSAPTVAITNAFMRGANYIANNVMMLDSPNLVMNTAKAATEYALSAQVQDARSDDDEEIYEIGVREGYERAVQEIDIKTGGDGEYRYCTDHDPERHTPGPVEMIQRIVDRFETLNLIGEAEKRGDFWDVPGSAQAQDVAERDPKEIATWEDQQAFEAWAQGERYEMHQHPLHYLFVDPKTNAARQGWKAALQFARDRLPAAPAKQEG
jgi:hypothetical protein